MSESSKMLDSMRRQHEREHAEWERGTGQELRALKADLQNLMPRHSGGDALIMLEDFNDLLSERMRETEPLWSDWL